MDEHLNGSSESASHRSSWSVRAASDDQPSRTAADNLSDERRSGWFDGCSEGLFRIDLSPPLDVNSPETVVLRNWQAHGMLRECNAAMLPFLGAETIGVVEGTPVRSHDFLISIGAHFIRNGCRLEDHPIEGRGAENVSVGAVGAYDNGALARVWGRCRYDAMPEQVAVLDALERQKQQIGLELHDGMGQLLTAVRITSQDLAERLSDKHDSSVRQLSLRLSGEAEEALGLLREITSRLSPSALLRGDTLLSALEVLVAKTCRFASVDCRLEWHGDIRIADDQRRIHVYRIVQEAVTNALKHAQATAIVVTGSERADGIDLTVRDDGVGFDSTSPTGESIGIESLHHRAAVIGAELTISSSRSGTEVSCFIPKRYLAQESRNGRPI